ncbi:MAG: cell wall hydrolase [Patescibacteria group bacterium]
MQNRVTLKLVGVRYGGTSIGEDIRVEFDISGRTVQYDTQLKKGQSIAPNFTLGSIPIKKKPLTISATIRVIERDVLFSDKGQIAVQLMIDPNAPFPQRSTHIISVRESRGFLTKRTARFEITIEADAQKRIPTVDDPLWTGDFHDDSDQMILARAIFGEGRSLSKKGRTAIGWVVRNRIGYSQWGMTYHDVILRPRHFSAFNTSDQNRKLVEDPSSDPTQRSAWHQCYELAGALVKGRIPDPVKGANHYYSDFIKPPSWTHTKGAVLTLRVENTLFYRLPIRSKRIILPIILLGASLVVFGFSAYAQVARTPLHFNLDEERRVHSSESIANHSIAVYYGCGTECEGVRIFDETTGKQRASFNYGVGYLWSANKKYVAAFHASAGQGVTIGDMSGNQLFVYTKPLEKSFDIPSVARWAPNDSKLAVLFNDNGQQDLFVFWGFENGSTRVTSVRVPPAEHYAIEWDATGKRVQVNGGSAILDIADSGYGHQYTR